MDIFDIIERVVDFDNLTIHTPYKKVGKHIYNGICKKIRNNKFVNAIKRNPEIQIKIKETESNV